jgi:hypothetical protein
VSPVISRYAKTCVAALLAGAYALQAALSDGQVTNTEWLGIGTAALIALGVFAVPNKPAPVEAEKDGPVDPNVGIKAGLGYPPVQLTVNGGSYGKRLGKRPPKNAPALMFAEHLTSVPEHPIADLAPSFNWPMDHNDQAGDCVVAGLDHALQAIYGQLTGSYTNWSDQQMLTYYQTQNPGFKRWSQGGTSVDGGMDIQTFLEFLVRQNEILGFAKVDHTNLEQMKAAIYLGLGVVTGEMLTRRNLSERVWDYHRGDPQEGGHCTVSVGYHPAEDVVSWGDVYGFTDAFVKNSLDEAWFIVTQAHVDHPAFRAHFDVNSFAAAYTAITGRPFPVSVPPGPVDPPSPVVTADVDDRRLWASIRTWVAGGHGSTTRAVAADLDDWATRKGLE